MGIYLFSHSGDERLETTMSTVEEKNKLAAVPSSTNLRMRSHTRTVNKKGDETLARSLTLAYLADTSITPKFNRVRMPTRTLTVGGVLTIFVGGDGGKSKP